MSTSPTTQSINMNAKERFEGMWTTIRSMAQDQEAKDGTIQGRLKKAMDLTGATASSETLEGLAKVLFGACTTEFPGGPDSPARKCTMQSPSRNSSASSVGSVNSLTRRVTLSPVRGSRSTFIPYKKSPSQPDRGQQSQPTKLVSRAEQKEEYFYAQFLSEDRNRAERAVSSLREHPPSLRTTTPTPKDDGNRGIPKPFPVSTPPKKEDPMPVPEVLPVSSSSPTESSQNGEMGPDLSFDDGISAISAYTLEEMASEQQRRKREGHDNGADSQQPSDEAVWTRIPYRRQSCAPQSSTPPRVKDHAPIPSPASFRRGGASFGSRGTYHSRLTKSTRSSATTDFENAWKRDELKYWEGVVENGDEEGHDVGYDISKLSPEAQRRLTSLHKAQEASHRTKGGQLPPMLQSNRTISTAGSSTYHSDRSPSQRYHPHDTLYLEASDCVPRKVIHAGSSRFDPDRIEQVLVLEHETELGEI